MFFLVISKGSGAGPAPCRSGTGWRAASCGGEVEAGAHVEAEPAVGVDVRPEKRGKPPPVFLSEFRGPARVAEDRLKELGVDVDQAGLQEVEREHGDLGVLAVVAGDDALA